MDRCPSCSAVLHGARHGCRRETALGLVTIGTDGTTTVVPVDSATARGRTSVSAVEAALLVVLALLVLTVAVSASAGLS